MTRRRLARPRRPPTNKKHKKGVESYEVSLEQQKVVVRGNVTPEAVLATVSKTGKKTELVQ